MYNVRVTTTFEQLDYDGRVLFSVSDTADASTINDAKNTVDVPRGFHIAEAIVSERICAVIKGRYECY